MNKNNSELRQYSGMLVGGLKGLTILGVKSLGRGCVAIWGVLKAHPSVVFFILFVISLFGNVYQSFHLHQMEARGLIMSDSMYDSEQRARARTYYDKGYKAAFADIKNGKAMTADEIIAQENKQFGTENTQQTGNGYYKKRTATPVVKEEQQPQQQPQVQEKSIDQKVSDFTGKKYGTGAAKKAVEPVKPAKKVEEHQQPTTPVHHTEQKPEVVE